MGGTSHAVTAPHGARNHSLLAPWPRRRFADLLSWVRGPGRALPKRFLSAIANVRIAPLYVIIVVAVGLILDRVVDEQTRHSWVLANSTNVANLASHRIWTLVTSVFFINEPVQASSMVKLLILTSAAEMLWGWRRMVGVFLLSNALASGIVYALLRAGADGVWFAAAADTAVDVGVSYGACAVGAAIAAGLSRRLLRWLLVPAVLVPVLMPVLGGGPTFTDVGHLISTLIGIGLGWRIRRHRAGTGPSNHLSYQGDGPVPAVYASSSFKTPLRNRPHRQEPAEGVPAAEETLV